MGIVPPLSVRWILCTLGIYASSMLFAQRASLSVAIVAMTTTPTTTKSVQVNTVGHCIEPKHLPLSTSINANMNQSLYFYGQLIDDWRPTNASNNLKPEFDWNETLQGIILGSQFYLYIVVPSVAGRITDVFGGKWVGLAGALGPCVLSAVTPVATRAWGAPALIAIRTLMGGFHGCIFPSLFSLYTRWFPVSERATANAGLSFGTGFGSAVMYVVAGRLCQTVVGWPLVFYVCTALYVPWIVLWLYYCTNDPQHNARIRPDELEYLRANMPTKTITTTTNTSNPKRARTPWLALLTSVPVLCSAVTKLCSGFGFNLFTTKMPSYLSTVFGVDIFRNGAVNASATLAQAVCSLFAGPLSTWVIGRFKVRSLVVRKLFQSVAMFGPAACLCVIPALGCLAWPVVGLLVGSMLLYGFFTGGEWTIVSEYAPNSAGAVFGFANILAYSSGVAVPYLVGVLLDSATNSEELAQRWNWIFWITGGVYSFGAVAFLVFGTDVQQPWDKLCGDEVVVDDGGNGEVDADKIETGDNLQHK